MISIVSMDSAGGSTKAPHQLISIEPVLGDSSVCVPTGLTFQTAIVGNRINVTITSPS